MRVNDFDGRDAESRHVADEGPIWALHLAKVLQRDRQPFADSGGRSCPDTRCQDAMRMHSLQGNSKPTLGDAWHRCEIFDERALLARHGR